MRRSIRSSALLLAVLTLGTARAQAQESAVEGTVRGADGAGIPGVNVFLVETLEGALTDSAGAFRFETRYLGSAILVLLHPDFAEERRPVDLPLAGALDVALTGIVTVDAIQVRAGGYTAGDEPGSTLTSLDVVTTPGAQASVPLAIKTLPGVQNVDDGSGLFVRGGDSQETRFFLNEAGVLDAIRPEEPAGSSAPQIDPFLLDRIFFSSGAFGARYGNALSAVVDLETRGRPERFEPSVGAHMAGVEGSVEGPLGARAGGALTVSRLHVGPIYAVNGSTRDYGTVPQGWEASGSLVWDYRPTGQLKAFAIGETFETAFDVKEASFAGEYAIESDASAAIVTWRDRLGPAEPVVSVSRSSARSEEAGGAFRLDDDRVSTQLFAAVAVPRSTALVLTAGGEVERVEAALTGEIPSDGSDRGEGAATDELDFDGADERRGAFLEGEWAATSRLGVTAGIRTDRSTLSDERTWDPRLSLAWNPRPGLSLLLGGGVYHQVADPLLYARNDGPRLASQRALQLVAGIQAGTPSEGLVRVEAFLKRYDELAQLDRDDRAIGGGEGESRGLDVFLKGGGPWGTSGWIAWSLVDAERTDPDTGALARARFDVTHSLIAVVGRQIRPGWNARAAWRYATGRPFTDVAGATPSADDPGMWVPSYSEPFGARQPAFHRLDLSFSRLVFFGEDGLLVLFASLNNVYDRFNVLEYRWSSDYAERFPVRDRSARSVFVGMSIDF
jgi:hypothetical protein